MDPDSLIAEETRIMQDDPSYSLLYKHYHELCQENGWNVALVIPSHGGITNVWTLRSLIGMYRPRGMTYVPTGCFVDVLRNRSIKESLKNPEITHLFFIDSDMVLPFFGLMRLLQRRQEVVCGLYMQRAPPFNWLIYQYQEGVKVPQRTDLKEEWKNQVIEVGGSGGGCLLVSKDVFFKVGYPWFHISYTKGTTTTPAAQDYLSEDVQFFMKCHQVGIKTFMDTSVLCQHMNGTLAFPHHLGDDKAIDENKLNI